MSDFSKITLDTKDIVNLKIYYKRLKYDNLEITVNNVLPKVPRNQINLNKKDLGFAKGDFLRNKNNNVLFLNINGILMHYIIQELKISPVYRSRFIKTIKYYSNPAYLVIFQLIPAQKEIIDYSWNYRTTNMAQERLELDHALSWLSTLGGAFSALGDYFSNCALIAGNISFHQLKLALRLGDPTVAARCKLYMSLSFIQRGYLKRARKIIYKEYTAAKSAVVVDIRLIRMCLGIWAKLKYEHGRRKIHNQMICT